MHIYIYIYIMYIYIYIYIERERDTHVYMFSRLGVMEVGGRQLELDHLPGGRS